MKIQTTIESDVNGVTISGRCFPQGKFDIGKGKRMLSEALQKGLTRYAIGEKLRALRLRKKLGLVELGRHTGLSPAMLSKLERGKLHPTLPTLLRIAMVFSVGLDSFFVDDRARHPLAVVRKRERKKFPETAAGKNVSYHFESLDFSVVDRKLNSYWAEFESVAPDKIRLHHHTGVEMIYVMTGKLAIRVGSEENSLVAGDAIYFDSSVLHGYRRTGRERCTGIVVTAA
jgi:transcriptional regulator with XRE-family HTH domain